jgi:hypothetical protein
MKISPKQLDLEHSCSFTCAKRTDHVILEARLALLEKAVAHWRWRAQHQFSKRVVNKKPPEGDF